jgi:hypothetical protein
MFFQKNRRQIDRYAVLWDGVLEVRYTDYETRMTVTVSDFSGKGAMIQADRMFVNDRLLISAHHQPRLTLKAFSPLGMFQARVKICWYRWDVDKNGFEIGLEYVDPSPENQLLASQVLSMLHKQYRRAHGFYRRLKGDTTPPPAPCRTRPSRSPA